MKQKEMENFDKAKNFCDTTAANHDDDLYLLSWGVSTRNGNKLVFATFTLAVWRYPDAMPISCIFLSYENLLS